MENWLLVQGLGSSVVAVVKEVSDGTLVSVDLELLVSDVDAGVKTVWGVSIV